MLFYELVTDGFTLESLRNGEAPKVSRLSDRMICAYRMDRSFQVITAYLSGKRTEHTTIYACSTL